MDVPDSARDTKRARRAVRKVNEDQVDTTVQQETNAAPKNKNSADTLERRNMDGKRWMLETRNKPERARSSTAAQLVSCNRMGRALKPPQAEALVKLFNVGLEHGRVDQDTVSMLYWSLENMANLKEKNRIKENVGDLHPFQYQRPEEEKSIADPRYMTCFMYETKAQSERFMEMLAGRRIDEDVVTLRDAL